GFENLLLLACDRLGGTFARAGISVGALTAYRQSTTVTQAAVTSEIHETLDVHGDFASQVAFHHIIAIDDFANLQHLLVTELIYPPILRNSDLTHDLVGLFRTNAMDVLQRNDHALVSWYIDAGDAGHGSVSYCRHAKEPANIPFREPFAKQ